jgi:hypothetical protein
MLINGSIEAGLGLALLSAHIRSHRGRHSCLTYFNASLLCRQRLLRN